MGLMDGKKGLILNVANDRSIAWHIANNAIKQGKPDMSFIARSSCSNRRGSRLRGSASPTSPSRRRRIPRTAPASSA